MNKTAYDVFILSQSNSHGWLYKKGCFSEQKQIRLGFIWTQTTLCHFSHFNGFAATLHCQPRATSSERQNLRTRDGMHEKPPWKAKGTYTHIIYIRYIYILVAFKYIYIYIDTHIFLKQQKRCYHKRPSLLSHQRKWPPGKNETFLRVICRRSQKRKLSKEMYQDTLTKGMVGHGCNDRDWIRIHRSNLHE